MTRLFTLLLGWIRGADTATLAQQVAYLKEENAILRSTLPKRVAVTAPERYRLLELARPLDAAIKFLVGTQRRPRAHRAPGGRAVLIGAGRLAQHLAIRSWRDATSRWPTAHRNPSHPL